jgi:hypothetical protein
MSILSGKASRSMYGADVAMSTSAEEIDKLYTAGTSESITRPISTALLAERRYTSAGEG